MKLGMNLSFAIKRWTEPELLASMIKNDFQTEHVQFSWDFIDPWWPEGTRNSLAYEFRNAFDSAGVMIDNTFGGTAAYAFSHFLAYSRQQRDLALEYFKRAADLTLSLGTTVMGSPAGSLSYKEARDPQVRAERYEDMLSYYSRLAEYGKSAGFTEIQVEATPLFTEIPYSPELSVRMMKDLEGTAIPIRLLVDWGHALFKPLLKDEADIEVWFKQCAPYIRGIHLQQTDGEWDRHWDFTSKAGIVTPELILRATHDAGLDDITQYLEVVPIYEDDDDALYSRMKRTMDYLHKTLNT